MTYLKITNFEENHNGLQYKDGLIEDIIPFAKEGSCCPGGIYFSNENNICEFVSYGIWIREVTIPEDAEMVQDPEGVKWRASKVILGERKCLLDALTWEWMVSIGVDVHVCSEIALRWASLYGHLEVVKYLVSLGADIHVLHECALRDASQYGHLEVVKYLVSLGANIHANNEFALRAAFECGYLEVVAFLESCK